MVIYDGVLTVGGGVDAGANPLDLQINKIADARNVTVSGGRARSRPDFLKLMNLPEGNLQGAGFFEANGTIIAQIEGRLYELFPSDLSYIDITPDGGNNPNSSRIWTVNTDSGIVIQDGKARPIIYDGYKARRTVGNEEIPVGQAMGYGNGRLAVVVEAGDKVRIGDIYQPGVKDSEYKFTETTFLLGGGDFSFPAPVTALFHLPVLDTATGAGSLLVATRKSLYSLATDVTDRDLWPSVKGFQSVLFTKTGVAGPEAFSVVNQDVWFRANDGLRSLRMTVTDYNSPGNTPLSTEVKHRLSFDSNHLLPYVSTAYFDNRLLCTSVPLHYEQRAMFHTTMALNFDARHSLGQSSTPAYDGFWDGVKILQFVQGEVKRRERCYFLGVTSSGQNSLFEVQRENDSTYHLVPPTVVNPAKEVTTRALSGIGPAGEMKLQLKKLARADVAWSEIEGDVSATIYFKPDQFPYFIEWHTWEFNSELDFDEDPLSEYVWDPAARGYRTKLSTKSPPEEIHWMNDRGVDIGFSFQIKVVWTGRAQLDSIKVKMESVEDQAPADNPTETGNNTRIKKTDISSPIYTPDDDVFKFYSDDSIPLDDGGYLVTGDGSTLLSCGDGITFLSLGGTS